MSDISHCDRYATICSERNAKAIKEYWGPKRMGETTRTCATCGREFEPRSRNHKYCSKDCNPHH